MAEYTVIVDGRPIEANPDELILQVINRLGESLPQVCYQPDLGPIQSCDTCFVEANGALVRACGTSVQDQMTISLTSSLAQSARREGMNRILRNHDLYCTVCENNNGNCVVHNTFDQMDIDHPPYDFTPKPYEVDASHAFYRYDPNQCILCGRCVEACQDFQVNETLSIDWSLEHPRVVWDGGVPAGSSSCVGCGHCVTVCPCNALMEKSMLGKAGLITAIPRKVKDPLIHLTKSVEPATGERAILALSQAESEMRPRQIKRTKTVCTYCGVGCSFEMWTRGRHILKVEPVTEGPANAISTCVKGKFGWDYVNSKERLTKPLIRKGDEFVESTWDEALTTIATAMQGIKATSGPDALGFISSSKCTNEESYLMQKLARAVVGTNNVDNCSRYCQAPATMGLWRTVGYGGDSGSIKDIYGAEMVIIVGSNTAESHPVLATRVKRAHKRNGQKLVVADLRKNEMAERADLFIQPAPGTDQIWLAAITKYILDNNMEDKQFISDHTNGFSDYHKSLEGITLEYAEEVTKIPAAELIQIADMIVASKGVCILWAMGVTQHGGGSDTSTAISNLLLVTGNYMKPHAGAYPLRGHNNVQGASDFGSMPSMLPGYQSVSDPGIIANYEAGWRTSIPTTKGLDNHEMVDAIYKGDLKFLYLIGEDMGLVDSNALHVQEAFERLQFFVVQDIFFSNTARFANVILPAAPSVEKEGTFVNTERRIQRLYKVMEPLGDSRPDWEIIRDLANSLDANWDYSHPSEILAEAASLTPIFAGASYERLEGFNSLQWPISPEGVDTPVLYTEGFTFDDKRAKFFPLTYAAPSEEADAEYDLHLNNGRLLEHFHEGNLTYRSEGIRVNTPSTFIEVSPELAQERGLKDGSLVRLISRRGAIRAHVVVTERVKANQLYLPMNSQSNESAINVLTSSHTDKATHTPAYKELAVKMEVLSVEGEPPLPKSNFRFGKRTPQAGVLVGEKWSRNDYVAPPAPRAEGGL